MVVGSRAEWIRALKLTPRPAQAGWTTYRAKARGWPQLFDVDVEAQLAEWAWEVARATEAQVRACQHRWDQWVQEAFDKDASARVFRFIKGPQVPAVAIINTATAPGDPTVQEVVQATAYPWVQLWSSELPQFRADELLPFRDWSLPGPIPTATEFRDLIAYRWNTAVGADHGQPRTLRWLSDHLIEWLFALWKIIILTGRIPIHINLLLIGLTPKSDGGERPITVFPTALRTLDRWYRWHYGAEWLTRQPAGSHYGMRRRTVEDAVWRQGLLAEWAAVAGKVAATYLLDISKAFLRAYEA